MVAIMNFLCFQYDLEKLWFLNWVLVSEFMMGAGYRAGDTKPYEALGDCFVDVCWDLVS